MAKNENTEAEAEAVPRKTPNLPMILGLVLFVLLGAGGFLAVQRGLILRGDDTAAADHGAAEVTALPAISYVKVTPLVINLGDTADARFLRFQAEIEVNASHSADVTLLLPRIVDVLNSYLRAVELRDLEDRSAIVRLRAQMQRRVQLVAGAGRVRDLLITEFVLN